MASSTIQDNHAKEGEQPAVPYNCQGSHPQVWCYPIYWVCNCKGLAHTLHIARPNQMAQGVGQSICKGDEDTTQLVA